MGYNYMTCREAITDCAEERIMSNLTGDPDSNDTFNDISSDTVVELFSCITDVIMSNEYYCDCVLSEIECCTSLGNGLNSIFGGNKYENNGSCIVECSDQLIDCIFDKDCMYAFVNYAYSDLFNPNQLTNLIYFNNSYCNNNSDTDSSQYCNSIWDSWSECALTNCLINSDENTFTCDNNNSDSVTSTSVINECNEDSIYENCFNIYCDNQRNDCINNNECSMELNSFLNNRNDCDMVEWYNKNCNIFINNEYVCSNEMLSYYFCLINNNCLNCVSPKEEKSCIIYVCESNPCDCDIDYNPHCKDGTCHSNGCDQCENGYFKKDYNYPCVDCQTYTGEGCIFCQDFNGCGQCSDGYLRVFDNDCGIYVCQTEEQVCGFSEINNDEYDCSNDENCANCPQNGGSQCNQCDTGYFVKSSNYPCINCHDFYQNTCNQCNNNQGCINCIEGYSIVWDNDCRINRCVKN